jgi:hypothetical protein
MPRSRLTTLLIAALPAVSVTSCADASGKAFDRQLPGRKPARQKASS